ncbi:MAG TPA: MlaD family protein [Nocardioidaceae bacterium]|nr:MlaD family protein [Nocardioidaceae bacterium]
MTTLVRGVAAGGALLLVAVLGGNLVTADTDTENTVTTTLVDAGSLEKGNEVRASGVQVGQVKDIELVDGQAKVTLEVDPGVLPLHDDASLLVKPVNLLGENYVDIDPGTPSAPFMDEAVIPTERTKTEVTLQDVLNTFHAPTAASLAAVVTALGEGLEGNGGEVAAALKALAPAMQNAEELGALLEDQNGVLDSLITKLDPVTGAMAVDNGAVLDSLVGSTQQMLAAVNADQEALEQTILELPGTLRSAQATLREFGGVADQATPVLRSIRPITDDLTAVTAELQRFADAADPALASLEPVLRHADVLLDQAAPAVAELRNAGPHLRRTAASARPVADKLVAQHLGDLMAFVRKWALSTNGRDGLSHYFRGVFYVTPTTLKSLAQSFVPASVGLPIEGAAGANKPKGLLPELGLDQILPNLNNALGLTSQQESNLLEQLLGGVL